MKFNDSSGRLGIVQDARALCGLEIDDTSSLTIHEAVRNGNSWLRRANSWIWSATSLWEYDDRNWTDLPIATATLVANQQDYELPTYLQRIIRVEVKDDTGDWIELKQIDQSEVGGAMTEYMETAGMPVEYDVIGRSLFLYPKPSATDVTLANGLKIYFSREISEFTVTSTNTEPGFTDNFHRLIPLGIAFDFSVSHNLQDRIGNLREQIERTKEEIELFYGGRNRAAKKLKINPSSEGVWGY